LSLRSVKSRAGALDFREELLPIGEGVSESVEHVFGFEIPERLELKPLGDVVRKLLDLILYHAECSFKFSIGKVGELQTTTNQHSVFPEKRKAYEEGIC
jgi:hypothetical protein